MISEQLQKARNFEEKYGKYADIERPAYHVTGTIGWINDPNGFSVYKGEYHLFFQYHPYSNEWGPMHWGHVKTRDFVKWERLPAALAPDTQADRDGCFSGSAIELPDGRQLLLYTGVNRIRRTDSLVEEFQHQCVAVGDGINYEKYEDNPVIDAGFLPEGGDALDFRDPKIFKDGDNYYCVVGNRTSDGSGSVLLFKSADAFKWEFVKVLDACYNEYGRMWECPDFFSLDDKQVLLVSPQEMRPIGLEFHAGYGSLCIIGSYDHKTYTFKREKVQAIDYGIDFYAPQTLKTPDGRQIMIAWMQNWTTIFCKRNGSRIHGSMTLPRELTIRDGRLFQKPVREIENYRSRKVSYENVIVKDTTTLGNVNGRCIDLNVTVKPFKNHNYKFFRMTFANDGEHFATIRYKSDSSTVRIDRTRCGSSFDIVHVRDFIVSQNKGVIKFRLMLDGNHAELFVNDGEEAASFLLYLDNNDAKAITFEADEEVLIDVEKYDLIID